MESPGVDHEDGKPATKKSENRFYGMIFFGRA